MISESEKQAVLRQLVSPSQPQPQTTAPFDALVLRDIDVPFGRMVAVMVKLGLAAVPACLLLFVIFKVAEWALLIPLGLLK